MDENQVSPASDNKEPNADERIAELERKNAELSSRYAASSNEAIRLNQQLQAFQHESPRQNIPQRGQSAYERLVETGVDAGAIDEIVDAKVSARIQAAFDPIARGFQARNQMLAEHPEYAKDEANVAAFVQNDPKMSEMYNRMFSADPVGANDWAYMKYGASVQKTHKSGRGSREGVADAAIPTERSGESRRRPDDGDVSELRREIREKGKTPDLVDRYAKARLRQVIPDSFLNQ